MEAKKTIEERLAARYTTCDYIFSCIKKINNTGKLVLYPEQISDVVDVIYHQLIEDYFATEALGLIGQNEFSFVDFKRAVLREARPHILSYIEDKNKDKGFQGLKI